MMKLFRTLLASFLLMLLVLPALAADALPQDIQDFFSTEKRSGYTIMSHCEIEDYAFVAAQNERGVNHLFGFKLDDGDWKYWLHTTTAIPQGEWLTIHNAQGGFRLCDEAVYQLPTLFIGRLEPDYHEFVDMSAAYVLRDGVWTLEDYSVGAMSGHCVTFDPGKLVYYTDSISPIGTIRATVQRNIRYVNLNNIPINYHDARAKLTAAPKLPASAELAAQNIKFTGGRRYEVYSAPGRDSYRSANGKAAVSTNSWIQVFGVEDGWAMIHYSIDADHYRIGYIVEEALPAKADVPDLDFDPVMCWLNRDVSLPDDPFYSGSRMDTLGHGDVVHWLASIGDWAYVEVYGYQTMRGFVPSGALEADMQHAPALTHVPDGGK